MAEIKSTAPKTLEWSPTTPHIRSISGRFVVTTTAQKAPADTHFGGYHPESRAECIVLMLMRPQTTDHVWSESTGMNWSDRKPMMDPRQLWSTATRWMCAWPFHTYRWCFSNGNVVFQRNVVHQSHYLQQGSPRARKSYEKLAEALGICLNV